MLPGVFCICCQESFVYAAKSLLYMPPGVFFYMLQRVFLYILQGVFVYAATIFLYMLQGVFFVYAARIVLVYAAMSFSVICCK